MLEPLPVDAALPALASARYEALAAALARVGLQGARAISVLRYNPGKRCTLAVVSDTDRYIVKLFADAATVLAVSTVHKVLAGADRKSTRLNSSHSQISYAVFCLKKKKTILILIVYHDRHGPHCTGHWWLPCFCITTRQ